MKSYDSDFFLYNYNYVQIFFCVDVGSPVESDHNEKYGVPTLEELGVKPSDLNTCLYPGGETEALKRLEKVLQNEVKQNLCVFFFHFNSIKLVA